MASGKALLKKYIKDNHFEEIEKLKSQNKQCKVSIDYENLNEFLITLSGTLTNFKVTLPVLKISSI